MIHRCKNPKYRDYHLYGGRGITVCERWMTFQNFYDDMGPRPGVGREYSVERIDNNAGYSPENCKWGTRAEQSANRRHCATPQDDATLRRLIVDERRTYKEAAKIMGKAKIRIEARVRRLGLPYAHTPQKITDRPDFSWADGDTP